MSLNIKSFIQRIIFKAKRLPVLEAVNRKTTHLSNSVKIILLIITIITLWMLTGIFKTGEHQTVKERNSAAKVKVVQSIAQERQVSITLNGYTKSSQSVEIKPETYGYVVKAMAKNGQFLKKGDPIIIVEPQNKDYAFKKAHAELEKQRLRYDAAQKIYEKELSSQGALKDALAELKSAEASFNQAKLDLDKTLINAPFNGYIDEVLVHEGDFINALNSVVAKFSSIDPLLVVVYVPQTLIGLVKDSKKVKAISDNDKVFDGKITFVSKVANPNTRTFQVEALINNIDESLHIGESIKLQIFFNEIKKLHSIPKSALILDTDGRISVKIMDETNQVKTIAVEIFDEDRDTFWVGGLPGEASIITLGNSYVKDGEVVEVTY